MTDKPHRVGDGRMRVILHRILALIHNQHTSEEHRIALEWFQGRLEERLRHEAGITA